MIHTYLDQIKQIRTEANQLLPLAKRVYGNSKYAEFRKAVLEWTIGHVHKRDRKLLKLVKTAVVRNDGKVHIEMSKLQPREAMTLSFLKMALFAVDLDAPLEHLFNSYAQQLGSLMMLSGQTNGTKVKG
jgi:hypothetical protein